MWKKNKYYILVGLFIVAILFIEYKKPRPINWFESYSKYDKIPYGNKILFSELPSIFSKNIFTSTENIDKSIPDITLHTDYLFINNTFTPEKKSISSLLEFVSQGNNAMIISRQYSEKFLDTLGISIKHTFSFGVNDSLCFKIESNKQQYYHKFRTSFVLNSFDLDSAVCSQKLGFVADTFVNFIKVPYGEGEFYMHLNPIVFTNYHMLKNDNHKYVSAILSHLPNNSVLWDEYYKNRKKAFHRSRLDLIIKTDGLRQALYLTVISLLIYMAFASKRKQRIIPLSVSKSNDTVSFVRTIGQLYYNEKNNKDIGMKRIDFFMSGIKKQYHISSEKLDDVFCINLHHLSGVPLKEVKRLIFNTKHINSAREVSDEKIIEQDKLIDNFYKKSR